MLGQWDNRPSVLYWRLSDFKWQAFLFMLYLIPLTQILHNTNISQDPDGVSKWKCKRYKSFFVPLCIFIFWTMWTCEIWERVSGTENKWKMNAMTTWCIWTIKLPRDQVSDVLSHGAKLLQSSLVGSIVNDRNHFFSLGPKPIPNLNMALTLNTETNRKQQISHDDLTIELEKLEPNLHQYCIRKNEVEEL